MVRGLDSPCQSHVFSISGANIQSMVNLVEGFTVTGPTILDVRQYTTLVFHVGTNNMKDSNKEIYNLYTYLVRAIRQRCVNTSVYLSCILPRPKDHWKTGPRVRAINRWLRRWTRTEGIQAIDAAPLFINDAGRVRDELYNTGRLHLNSNGLRKFRDKMRQVLGMALLGHA